MQRTEDSAVKNLCWFKKNHLLSGTLIFLLADFELLKTPCSSYLDSGDLGDASSTSSVRWKTPKGLPPR